MTNRAWAYSMRDLEMHGAALLLDLAPADPVAGAAAISALVVFCRSYFSGEYNGGLREFEQQLQAALAQLEAAHGA